MELVVRRSAARWPPLPDASGSSALYFLARLTLSILIDLSQLTKIRRKVKYNNKNKTNFMQMKNLNEGH